MKLPVPVEWIHVHYFSKDAPYRTTIMEPLGKMNAYFPIINEHISKRNKKVSFSC